MSRVDHTTEPDVTENYSNWGAGTKTVAVAFCVLIFAAFTIAVFKTGWSSGQVRYQQEVKSHEYAAEAEKKIENTCLPLEPGPKAECIRKIIEATNEHDRSERDLVAQTNMALWALGMLVITVVMTGFTGVGVYFVWLTFRETRETEIVSNCAMLRANIQFENIEKVPIESEVR